MGMQVEVIVAPPGIAACAIEVDPQSGAFAGNIDVDVAAVVADLAVNLGVAETEVFRTGDADHISRKDSAFFFDPSPDHKIVDMALAEMSP